MLAAACFDRARMHGRVIPVVLLAPVILLASCASGVGSANAAHGPQTAAENVSDDVLRWISEYIAPSSLFFTASEFEDISSGSPIYYYYHTTAHGASLVLVVDKYIPFKRVIERSSRIISDRSLRLLKTTHYYFDEQGGSEKLNFLVSQTGPFEIALSSRDIDIANFGSFEYLEISLSCESASVSVLQIDGEPREVLEMAGSGFRRFKRKNSVEAVNGFRTHETYVKDAGLYRTEERYYYPQREGAVFKRKVDVEELRTLLTASRMPFFFNNGP